MDFYGPKELMDAMQVRRRRFPFHSNTLIAIASITVSMASSSFVSPILRMPSAAHREFDPRVSRPHASAVTRFWKVNPSKRTANMHQAKIYDMGRGQHSELRYGEGPKSSSRIEVHVGGLIGCR